MVFGLTSHDNGGLFESIEVFNGLVVEGCFDYCQCVGFGLVSHQSGLVFEPGEEGGAFFLEIADCTWCGHPVCWGVVRWTLRNWWMQGTDGEIWMAECGGGVDFEKWWVGSCVGVWVTDQGCDLGRLAW